MTDYLILKATNEQGTIFAVHEEVTASSTESAIRKAAANDDNDTAVYAAIPKRSWQPLKVARQVKETVRLEPLP